MPFRHMLGVGAWCLLHQSVNQVAAWQSNDTSYTAALTNQPIIGRGLLPIQNPDYSQCVYWPGLAPQILYFGDALWLFTDRSYYTASFNVTSGELMGALTEHSPAPWYNASFVPPTPAQMQSHDPIEYPLAVAASRNSSQLCVKQQHDWRFVVTSYTYCTTDGLTWHSTVTPIISDLSYVDSYDPMYELILVPHKPAVYDQDGVYAIHLLPDPVTSVSGTANNITILAGVCNNEELIATISYSTDGLNFHAIATNTMQPYAFKSTPNQPGPLQSFVTNLVAQFESKSGAVTHWGMSVASVMFEWGGQLYWQVGTEIWVASTPVTLQYLQTTQTLNWTLAATIPCSPNALLLTVGDNLLIYANNSANHSIVYSASSMQQLQASFAANTVSGSVPSAPGSSGAGSNAPTHQLPQSAVIGISVAAGVVGLTLVVTGYMLWTKWQQRKPLASASTSTSKTLEPAHCTEVALDQPSYLEAGDAQTASAPGLAHSNDVELDLPPTYHEATVQHTDADRPPAYSPGAELAAIAAPVDVSAKINTSIDDEEAQRRQIHSWAG